MINEGRFLDAMKMDVDFVRARFGSTYDPKIQQMGEDFWAFGANR